MNDSIKSHMKDFHLGNTSEHMILPQSFSSKYRALQEHRRAAPDLDQGWKKIPGKIDI